jgi:hypothetical protein
MIDALLFRLQCRACPTGKLWVLLQQRRLHYRAQPAQDYMVRISQREEFLTLRFA